MKEFYEKNIQALKNRNHHFTQKDFKESSVNTIQVHQARNGLPTVKVVKDDGWQKVPIWLHSPYDPIREAELFVTNHEEILKSKRNVLVYGFGFGYHIEALMNRLQSHQTITIVDLNVEIFNVAMTYRDLTKIIQDQRINLIVSDDEIYISNRVLQALQEGAHLILHVPSVKSIPTKHNRLKFVLEDWNVQSKVGQEWQEKLRVNIEQNIKLQDPNVSCFFHQFTKKPFIIVSAGPSLNKNIHLLREIKKRAFIFSVGTALKPLLKQGIEPDMFCIIDPDPITYKQIEGIENLNIPFVYLISASSYTVSKYNGPRYVAYNEYSNILNLNRDQLISIGGSVATAVLDLSIKFGGNPIIFVGQDLAFSDNRTHVSGGMYGDHPEVKSLPNMRKVKGHNGEWLSTTLGLLSYKHWIENKIQEHPDIRFINATEGGAYIEGCEHMELRKVIDSVL